MEEMVRRANYYGEKFLIPDFKKDIKNVFNFSGVLKTFDVSSPRKDTVLKTYYDTPEKFFRKSGINITVNEYSNRNYQDIIVRYDSSQKRIKFISDLPDTFIKKIRKKENLKNHYDYMATGILELVPKGLNADVFETIKNIKPILIVTKKRERFRVINNDGLKMVLSFEKCIYKSGKNNTKVKLDMLEIRLESANKTKEMFDAFIKRLQLQQSMFIKQKHSDLFVGDDYLDI